MKLTLDRATKVLLVIVAVALWTNAVLLLFDSRSPNYSSDLESIQSHMEEMRSTIDRGFDHVDDRLNQIDQTLILRR